MLYKQKERADAIERAQALLRGAKTAGRQMTASERAQVESVIAEVKAIDDHRERAKENDALMARIDSFGPHVDDDDERGPGQLFSESQKEALTRAARTKSTFGATVRFKAPSLESSIGLPTTGTGVVEATSPKGVTSLRNLFDVQLAPGPTVRYYVVGNGTAAVVAEGALKPDAGITTSPVDAALVKIALTFQVSDELREDAPFLVDAIQRQAVRGVLVKENEEIVAALAGASGILTATGASANALDIIATEIGDQQAINGVQPTALVLNPTNLAAIRVAKASTGGSYFIDPLSSGPTSVHGVPLVPTAAVPPGTMYLLGEGFGTFYSRNVLRVETGWSGDDWDRNLMSTRVEERVLPAITVPALVTKITLT